jgi:hypothetical protein
MKRVGGKAVWEIAFTQELAELVRAGKKTSTVRSGSRVTDDDVLRLKDDFGSTIDEVNVLDVHDLEIRSHRNGFDARVNGKLVEWQCAEHIALRDGFGNMDEMIRFLDGLGKTPRGVFAGQIISW